MTMAQLLGCTMRTAATGMAVSFCVSALLGAQSNSQRQSRPSVLISRSQWTLIGPQPTIHPVFQFTSGRVLGLAVDPRDANVVYAATGGGGVWKTTDGGASWSPLTDTQSSLVIGCIALDPSNPDTVYAGTGQGLNVPTDHYGMGILKSTDRGSTWTNLPGPSGAGLNAIGLGAKFTALAVNPADGGIVLAGVSPASPNSLAVYRSADGGVTWTGMPSLTGTANSAFFDPTNGTIAYASLQGKGVYRSSDGGSTWSQINGTGANVLPTSNILTIQLAIAPSNPATLFAGIAAADATFLGLFKTIDSGQNWTRVANAPNYCRNQCQFDNSIVVDPSDANVVFLGGQEVVTSAGDANVILRSTDGGGTWTDLTRGANGNVVHVDVHAIAIAADGSRVYVGSDGGVWSSADVTASPVNWANLNATLAITQFYAGHSIHPTDVNIGYGGSQDNGLQRFNGGRVWSTIACGDAYASAIDPTNPATVYIVCDGLIEKSTGGGPFRLAQNGIDPSERRGKEPPLILDPSNPARLYFGTVRIYQSNDGGANWAAVSPVLPTAGQAFVSTIAVAPSDPDVVYAGLSGGRAKVTRNALAGTAATWTDISAGLPLRWINGIAVDSNSSSIAYAVVAGFTGPADNLGHIFHTTDGGTTWVDISGNLPNIPVKEIVPDQDVPGTLYAASDQGVFVTLDRGKTWAPLGGNMPNVVVLGLKLHRPTRTLRAATFGRGMWDIQVPLASTPLPGLFAGGTVNTASFAAGAPVAPGSLAAVFGANLASKPEIAGGVPLPFSLGGVSMRFGISTPVPIFFASAGQMNVQIPWELLGQTQVALATTVNGITFNAAAVNVAPFAPGIFTTKQTGTGQGAIQIANTNILVAPAGSIPGVQSRPAQKGEFLTIYCTGLGDVSNRPASGAASPESPLAATKANPSVTIGGADAPVIFSGLSPGFVGLYQVNAQVPPTAPGGDAVEVVLRIGAATSNTVTIAVQ